VRRSGRVGSGGAGSGSGSVRRVAKRAPEAGERFAQRGVDAGAEEWPPVVHAALDGDRDVAAAHRGADLDEQRRQRRGGELSGTRCDGCDGAPRLQRRLATGQPPLVRPPGQSGFFDRRHGRTADARTLMVTSKASQAC
jgi:hypothetical protein